MLWERGRRGERPRRVPFVWVVEVVAFGPGVTDVMSTMVDVG